MRRAWLHLALAAMLSLAACELTIGSAPPISDVTPVTRVEVTPVTPVPPVTHAAPPTTAAPVRPPERQPFTYVAVGASESVGVGADNPATEAWTAVLHRQAMHRKAKFVNLGISGVTVKMAIERELQQALDAKPDLVTVWLNANDLVHLVHPDDYERDLERLVHALRRGGRTDVLLANTPRMDQLPVVRACLPNPPPRPSCRFPVRPASADVVINRINAFNAAIDRIVQRQGAILVDLHATATIDASLVNPDGYHPSTEGHRRVAQAFARVLPKKYAR